MTDAMEWAAFQDNLLNDPDFSRGLTVKQKNLIIIVFNQVLKDKKNRHGVMDLLFNPAAESVIYHPVESTKHLTAFMANRFLDYCVAPDKTFSTKGTILLQFLENIEVNRNTLKGRLCSDRSEMNPGHVGPVCAYCGQPIVNRECDMHEVIITRGDVQKWEPYMIDMIFVPQNCVLVHHGECHSKASTREGQILCIQHLLQYEASESIANWINTLPFRSEMGVEALNLLKEACDV